MPKAGGEGFGDILDNATQPAQSAQKAWRLDNDGCRSCETESEIGERAKGAVDAAINVPVLDGNPANQHRVLVIEGTRSEIPGVEIQQARSGSIAKGHHDANESQVIRRAALPDSLSELFKHVPHSSSTFMTGQAPGPADAASARRVFDTVWKIADRKSFASSAGSTPRTSSPPCRIRTHPPNLAEQQDALNPQHPAHWQDHGVILSYVEPMLDPTPLEPVSSPAQQISERLGRALAEASTDGGQALPPTAMRSIKIILQPDQLGTVQVSLTLQHEGLHVRIIAGEAGTADLLRRDRHQLDGLLQPLAGDAQVSRVTISIEAAKDGSDAAFAAESEPSSQFQSGPSDGGFRRSHPGAGEAPAPDKDTGGNDPSGGMVLHESVAPIRRRLLGVIVV